MLASEIPSKVILAEEFAKRFDGFSIGSNDLTQLVLGVDRDSSELSDLFDERDEAVKRMVRDLIQRAHASGTKVGICGLPVIIRNLPSSSSGRESTRSP